MIVIDTNVLVYATVPGYNCRVAALMREHDVQKILTRDRDFSRIPGIQVLDPFR